MNDTLMKNARCDGSHCKSNWGQVRKYPLFGENGNLHLCYNCWQEENKYRYQCAHDELRMMLHGIYATPTLADEIQKRWEQHNWFTAETIME
jgi:hypothetical protein